MTNQPLPQATILGYPRIGANRELKRALESYWAGKSDQAALETAAQEVRQQTRDRLAELGLTAPSAQIADFTYYDQMLEVSAALGVVPPRFQDLLAEDGSLDLDAYFTLARGKGDLAAQEMTKWFDSNYHYLVPEIDENTKIDYVGKNLANQVREAVAAGVTPRPVVVGPVTYLLLAKASDDAKEGFSPLDRLGDVLHAYGHLLMDLQAAGAQWVQLDEPALASDTWEVDGYAIAQAVKEAYSWLGAIVERPQILVAGTYGSIEEYLPILAPTFIEGVALDLVAGEVPAAEALAELGGKTVVAGVVSGRNIWRTNLDVAAEKLAQVKAALPENTPLVVATSTSLQHVPHNVERETALDEQLRSWLAFADQKVGEVQVLARLLAEGEDAVQAELELDRRLREERANHPGVKRAEVRERVAQVSDADRTRTPYEEREPVASAKLGLPPLPTTTIGSFPQTKEIRAARAAHRAGKLSDADYQQAMKDEIAHVVKLQEELGLDVLVHGEAERNDMVQYFAELLEGFSATQHGWVQSYGSRCTRPSILWGDITRPAPMTTEWSAYAASLTDKPMKGMLTGPVTIMAWSFVRDDEEKGQVADQLGLALRDEIADLEEAGINVVQVDEPAIRELLPLRAADRPAYLKWSVDSFRLATGGASDETQIHTHLCYSEFNVVVDAIDHLDADVTSIEASRSRMDILPAVAEHGFGRQLGPGIYDIHSPRIPSVEEQTTLLQAAVDALGAKALWVNPDCGLKTRGYAEVEPALANMVAAAKAVRETL
ncbi:5-methyltetrahydropteroyltriglutamate--homocysteine S-methyltransferase [Boudabousia tangfeifanii]|uniref:5-methyltetrahydropteroyltriglutamate--homocysteine methyltransferase n=1 Tax=Boudabousia tangfeifanii TaxID=1912795 RepID=A0A1D9MKZ6_9ACTO|nr:5-methyltetrahydropteroyltriglutamate--homocysteine S-methyltransferase [Boudabousia tangfeifanii]AOZ72984.1 5-methyltetrahydropteroyltriglutamate--homocysteine S-methyltransferase [Boudabousia tangfeifanii]